MIVKFHPRGREQLVPVGGLSATGKRLRQRDGAYRSAAGKVRIGSLSTPRPMQKNHLRRAVFSERDLPPSQRGKLMASFGRAGSDTRTSIKTSTAMLCRLSTRTKGELELNFHIPNTGC